MKEVIIIIGLIGATLIIRSDLRDTPVTKSEPSIKDFASWYLEQKGR